MDFAKLSVGQKFTFPGKSIPPDFEGGVLEASPDSFWLLVYLPKISDGERKVLTKSRMTVRLLEFRDMLLTLVRFGDSPLILELPFDPLLYPDNRAVNLISQVNNLLMVGLDSSDSTIQALRLVSIPNELRRRWLKSWEAMGQMPHASDFYSGWLEGLFTRYSVLQLWDMAEYVGRFGEI